MGSILLALEDRRHGSTTRWSGSRTCRGDPPATVRKLIECGEPVVAPGGLPHRQSDR